MKVIITLFIFCSASMLHSQDSLKISSKFKKNNIYLSLAGENISGASLNYERCFLNTKYIHLGAGIGLGVNYLLDVNYLVPIYVSSKFGKKKHFGVISFGINNAFNPKPFPETKSERKEFEKKALDRNGDYSQYPYIFIDTYYPPYIYIPFVSIGYTFTSKKDFMLQPEVCFLRYQQNSLMQGYWHFFPKLKIGYAF